MQEIDSLTLVTIDRLHESVLRPLKRAFVEKDEIVDLLGICLLARENLFLLGPPGTAKSALVRGLSQCLEGRIFDYLLTRFTEPNELFGPFDIRRLREGELITNTEGMLPEADFVFLDELLNANSAILNSLLMALNERVFRRGRETRHLPALIFVGASNRLPEEESLKALFDRFLLRVSCNNVSDANLDNLLRAGWSMEKTATLGTKLLSVDSLAAAQQQVTTIDIAPIGEIYAEVVRKIRRAGIELSDRRAVRLQRPIAASALLCRRSAANITDLWVLRYIWDTQEQQEILSSIIDTTISKADELEIGLAHPRALVPARPNVELIQQELNNIREDSTHATGLSSAEGRQAIEQMREQLSTLANQCQWITNDVQREHLSQQIDLLWKELET